MDKILVIAPSWVGDMVMSQTLLKQLKRDYPSCQIDVLVNSWAQDVTKRMPEVNQVLVNPFAHGELNLRKRWQLGRQLRQYNYSHCIVLPNSLKSALIPWFASIPKRIGFVGEMRYGLLNEIYRLDKQNLPLMIDRFCALANQGQAVPQISYPQFTIDLTHQQSLVRSLNLDLTKPIICFCPAAEYGPAKRWLPEHFAKLALILIEHGYQVWIMGSNKDITIAQQIINYTNSPPQLINLCGKTNLVEVIDLLALASSVVSNDSGLMHIACAVNIPVIAIYGSSSASFTPPLSKYATIIQSNQPCAPCFARTCQYGHYRCLSEITPELIWQHLQNILPT
ncbi:MAG: lipopolysaccharide heptosyltransferase [Pseudomonadota bacterium]|jgi:heptosyltransferase-2